MEVLTPFSAGPRNLFSSGERTTSWGPRHQPLDLHHIPGKAQPYGPLAPPSPPYEMSGKPYSLPPISDLLAFSREEAGRRTERHNAHFDGRRSPPPATSHRRPSSGRSSPLHHSPRSAAGAPAHHAHQREMQPPLTMQPAHTISRIDPALFHDSSRQRQAHPSPASSTMSSGSRLGREPSFDYPRHQPLVSPPYAQAAPLKPYADASPRAAASAAPYYTTPRLEHHAQGLAAPGSATPSTAPSDSPMQAYRAAVAHPHDGQHGEASPRSTRLLAPPYGRESPKMLGRQLPSVTSAGYHPYPTHHRNASVHSADSGAAGPRPYVPPSPSSHLGGLDAASTSSAGALHDRYQCPTCAKAFSRPSSLRIHSHSHTGEKPFVCPRTGCGKAFSVRSNMKRHERGCHAGMGYAPPDHAAAEPRRDAPAAEDPQS